MKRVDFIGVPGSGKSAVCRELMHYRCGEDKWLISSEVKAVAARKLKPVSVKDYVKRLILGTGALKPIHKFCLESLQYRDLLFNERQKYQKLLTAFCEYLGCSPEEPLLKMQRARWLLEDIELLAIADANQIEKPIIFDEGLTQKIFTWFNIQDVSQLNGFPLPFAVVHFHCDQAMVHQRLQTRNKVAFQHKFYDADQVVVMQDRLHRKFQAAAVMMTSCGVRTLEIDTSKPLQQSAKSVQQFLQILQGCRI